MQSDYKSQQHTAYYCASIQLLVKHTKTWHCYCSFSWKCISSPLHVVVLQKDLISPHTAKTGKLTDSFCEFWNFTAYEEIYLSCLGHLTGAATEAGGHAWGQTSVCSKVCHVRPFQQEKACDARRPQWYLRWPVGGVQKCLLSWVQCLSQVHTLESSHSALHTVVDMFTIINLSEITR